MTSRQLLRSFLVFMHFSYIRSDPMIDFLSSFRIAEFTFLSGLFWHINQCSALTSLVSTFAHETRETAHETSFLLLLTKRVSRNEFFASAHETSAHETSAHETSFLALLTKRVLTKRIFGLCSRNEFHETSFLSVLTKRVLTKRVLTKRVFEHCSRNECSRTEFKLVSAEHWNWYVDFIHRSVH